MSISAATFEWHSGRSIWVAAAARSLGNVLARTPLVAEWIVLTRPRPADAQIEFYVVRPAELQQLAKEVTRPPDQPLERVLADIGLAPAVIFRNGRFTTPQSPQPTVTRAVDIDAAGVVQRIGSPWPATREKSPPARFRGGRTSILAPAPPPAAPPFPAPAASHDVTLSAQTQSEINLGDSVPVVFRMELSSEAQPLASSLQASVALDQPVVVSLTVESDVLLIVGKRSFTLDPPTSQNPKTEKFSVAGNRTGDARVAVTFGQGGSTLGVIGFIMSVVEEGAAATAATRTMQAAPREVADDEKLALLIEQRVDNNVVRYEYILHSEGLGLTYRKVSSKPFLDQAGGPAASLLQFIGRVYARVTQEIKGGNDLQELQRETRALGVSLCAELLDPEVTRILWPLRERLKMIQIVSWEPYIPWELVRLKHPDTGEVDARFLAEYGLVRTLSDVPAPRSLALSDWSYLRAVYPFKSLPDVGAEIEFLSGSGPNTLESHGIKPRAIPPTRDDFYDALAGGAFDVLHICCHAESLHESIDAATLIFSDEKAPGDTQARRVEANATTVAAEAQLKARHGLVFLNGCETGRVGPVLTEWGGWPNVFLRAGAGVFVGSSWSVRDKPAAVFCQTFYSALLSDRMLYEAASAARQAAKQLGDASWLAYKVYGHPSAKRKITCAP